MLYRVLCFALLFGAPAAVSAATVPPDAVTGASAGEQLAALLYGFRATGEAVPHPMNNADGNRMWDALGGGCIDGGSWDEPFPAGKSDIRSPAFCIPQPCVRLLAPEELEREVLGRRLEEGEYATYLERIEEACGELPPSPAGIDLASLDWIELVSASGDEQIEAPELGYDVAASTAAAGDFQWVRPKGRRDGGGFVRSQGFGRPSFGGGTRTTHPGSGGRSTTGKEIWTPKPDLKSPPSIFEPKPSTPDPETQTPTRPDPDLGTPDPNVPQPSPVPLPGGLAMLLTAVAAFAIRRR